MTNPRTNGAADTLAGRARSGLGHLTGDSRLQIEGRFNEYKGKARDAYGRVIDGLDGLVAKAPAEYQDQARKGLDFARRKPLLTTGIIAGIVFILSRSSQNRR